MSKNSLITGQTEPYNTSSSQDILIAAKGGGILFFGRLFEYASRFIFGIIAGYHEVASA